MKKLFSFLFTLLCGVVDFAWSTEIFLQYMKVGLIAGMLGALAALFAPIAQGQLVPRQTVEPGAGLVFCTSTDLTDSYTCPTATPIITALTPNLPVLLTVATSNTGAATLVVRSIGSPITILAHDGSTLANNAITAGRPYLLIYNGTNYLLYAGGSGAGGALSGLTDEFILKANGASGAQDSSIKDDGTGNICIGNCAGNHHRLIPDTATAVRSHGLPDASGKITYVKSIPIPIGDIFGSVLTDSHDRPFMWRNNVAPMTITEVWCQSDAGSPVINLQRDDGTPANILSSNLTVTTSGATGTISASEKNLAVGDKIGFVMVTAGGVAKEINCQVKATLDP